MRLNPETPTTDLAALATAERDSDRRRRELERLARLCSPRTTDVSVTLVRSGARCRPGDGIDEYEIELPTERIRQIHTSLTDHEWDRLVQETLLFHELGHVQYSDFDQFGTRLEKIGGRWQPLFRAVYNVAEDAAVETQIAREFSVELDFEMLNATLASLADERHRRFVELFESTDRCDGGDRSDGDEQVRTYTVFEALEIGILDLGVWDSGRYAVILDPDDETRAVWNGHREALVGLAPALEEYAMAMRSEPDGAERVTLAAEFFDRARDALANLPPLQRIRLQTMPVRPQDARAAAGWTAAPADRLVEDGEGGGRAKRAASRGEPKGAESSEENGHVVSGGRGLLTGTDATRLEEISGRPGTGLEAGNSSDAGWGKRRSRARSSGSGRSQNGRSPLAAEAERLRAVLRDDDVDVAEAVIPKPVPGGGDRDRWERANDRARGLVADLQTELRRERRPRDVTGYRSGRVDSRRLVGAYRGRETIFTRRVAGSRKDYNCLILLDRSSSMDGEVIRTAEDATAQLAGALSKVGVDVSVLSIWRDRACLEVPFGAGPAGFVDRLMTGRSEGSTPLADGLAVARHRLVGGRGSAPFVIVVTDGWPNDESAYRHELDRCSVPVFGVYVSADRELHADLFDRVVYAEPDGLERTLRRLVRGAFASGGGRS